MGKTVGVLALQGDFEKHEAALRRAGATQVNEVRTPADLDGIGGLVIPGGESTTMLKLIGYRKLWSLCGISDPKSRSSAPAPASSCWPRR